MDIQYLGHASFKLRGKTGTVCTDPYPTKIGFEMPTVSADIVTVSHDHWDHNAVDQVSNTARREEPYVITAPGEYEVEEIGVFGWGSFHDDDNGAERGKNTIYVIHIDGVRICHLGDLGHELSDSLVEDIGVVDVLLIPVGGVYTIDAKKAVKVAAQLQPGIVIPMHYKTEKHTGDVFDEVVGVEDFLKELGAEAKEPQEKLKVSDSSIPDEMEVVLLDF